MLTVKLVRHGEPDANIGKVSTHEVGDHEVALSPRGHERELDSLANPGNCAIVTIGDKATLDRPQFTSGRWGVSGLSLRVD